MKSKISIISAVALALLCTACSGNTVSESVVSENTVTESTVSESAVTESTAAQTTTTAETTAATTESTTTTTATAETEPAESTATTTGSTPEEAVTTAETSDTTAPEEIKTPEDSNALAYTDIVNEDGTYTQTTFDPDTIPVWSNVSAFEDAEYLEYLASSNKVSSPSKIPYSQITIENAHEAFPFLGWLGYTPVYTMVLPTDSPEVITHKVRDNLMGNRPTSGYDLWKYYNFSSEAEYNVYLAEQEKARLEAEALGQQAAADKADPNHKIGEGGTDESIDDMFSKYGY